MIMITQWLCPARHAALAVAWDDTTMTSEKIEKGALEIAGHMGLRAACGICGDPLAFDHSKARFDSLEETQRYLQALVPQMMMARQQLYDAGLAKEPPPWGDPRARQERHRWS